MILPTYSVMLFLWTKVIKSDDTKYTKWIHLVSCMSKITPENMQLYDIYPIGILHDGIFYVIV